MRLLLDTCVWSGVAGELKVAGHDVDWVGDWERDPGDEVILARAFAEGRVLVTLDKDFGELAIVHGRLHCGLIRLAGWPARGQGRACAEAIARFGEELSHGGIVTAEPGRWRVRPDSSA